ncbi:MAG: LPD25 domain-containing protein, partial [Planococcus donghaensis]
LQSNELKTKNVMFYKIGHVFEYTQTNAREKGLEVSEIFGRFHRDGTVENDKEFTKAFEKIGENLGVKFVNDPPSELGTAKGAFYPDLKVIALNPRNTIADNIPVAIHELAHASLHSRDMEKQRERSLTTQEEEYQAEMVAYIVGTHYGIEMENFSVPYIANWAKNATIEDKEQLLKEVRQTSNNFIEIIDTEMSKNLNKELEFEKPVHLIEFNHLQELEITPVKTKEQLLEKVESAFENDSDKDAVKEVAKLKETDFQNTSELFSSINSTLGQRFHVHEHEDDRPKMLIEWSEHNKLPDNTVLNFGEGNQLLADTERSIEDKENGYFKTRYHLLISNNENLESVPVDRLDIGDGYYTSPYQQIISELPDLPKEQHNALLTDMAIYQHESLRGDFSKDTIEKPMMMIHGYKNEFAEFGEVNNLPFEDLKTSEIKYTVAYPHENDVQVYSNHYESKEYIHPLHQMKNDESFDKEVYLKLEDTWHDALIKEDEKDMNNIIGRVREEYYKHEGISEKITPTAKHDLER